MLGALATLVLWAYLVVAHDFNRIVQLLLLFLAFALFWYLARIFLSHANSASHVRKRTWLAVKVVMGIASAIAVLWLQGFFGGSEGIADSTLTCGDCTPILVSSVIDGDTVVSGIERIRLFGIDAPEIGERCADGATQRLAELASEEVRIEGGPRARDVYGRRLAYLYTRDGQSIDEVLIAEGHAVAWERDGQHRDFLVGVEREARLGNVGCLW